MLATNAEGAEELILKSTRKVQQMRRELAELPKPTRWQFGLRFKRNWLEGKIEAEIDYAKRLQRLSDKIG